MRPVVLHVGLPKTGTTSLQRELFARHPGLCLVGKPLTRLDPRMHRLLTAILRLEPWEYRRVEPELAALVPELLDRPGDTVLISDEELSTGSLGARVDRLTIADRLQRLFPTAEVVFTVREQSDALRSMYGELRRLGAASEPLSAWAERRLALPETAAGLHLFRYDDLYAIYAERFERVHVVPYEQLRATPEAFVRALCGLLRVDPGEGWRCFSSGSLHNAGRAEVLPETTREAVRDRFATSNHRLVQATGLALEGWGYRSQP